MTTELDLQKHTFTSPKFRSVIDEAVKFMLSSPLHAIPPVQSFAGAGVYALYYRGKFDYYQHVSIAEENESRAPIYVGKAVPPGWRIGRSASGNTTRGSLFRRIAEHAKNIRAVENLQVEDFSCRFMILEGTESDLISACEAHLIRKFRPLWNSVVDGFGNHTPGKGRFEQAKSEWDVLHPGRTWAERCRGIPPTPESVVAKILSHRDG